MKGTNITIGMRGTNIFIGRTEHVHTDQKRPKAKEGSHERTSNRIRLHVAYGLPRRSGKRGTSRGLARGCDRQDKLGRGPRGSCPIQSSSG